MANAVETIRTAGGVEIQLSDQSPNITLKAPGGTEVIVDGNSVVISAAGSRVRIMAGIVSIDAAQVQIDAPILTARVIRCDTIIAASVVGASYTPGAGNTM